jgi:hypothetical protein
VLHGLKKNLIICIYECDDQVLTDESRAYVVRKFFIINIYMKNEKPINSCSNIHTYIFTCTVIYTCIYIHIFMYLSTYVLICGWTHFYVVYLSICLHWYKYISTVCLCLLVSRCILMRNRCPFDTPCRLGQYSKCNVHMEIWRGILAKKRRRHLPFSLYCTYNFQWTCGSVHLQSSKNYVVVAMISAQQN